ncbi:MULTISPECIES: hypothetical protein [unclassified Leptospira]|uniref:hypothetical protein n=1 Tax=unclassified Leptospira TaxID=2633828 RepID=UPI0002BD897E|nr:MULTISPECIES: hypothetical protein [unclassified Leptospira]EMK01433.1 hypothetical protein LEP1GSC192_2739 [Leptospira sp. B5-022]MCR1794395.1 hypothetical protein [Leptospira sp. id769339]
MEIPSYSLSDWRTSVARYAEEILRIGHQKSPFWIAVRTFVSASCETDDPEPFYDDLDSGFKRELTEEDEARLDEALSYFWDQATAVLIAISEAYSDEDEERSEEITDEAISGLLSGLNDAGVKTMSDAELLEIAVLVINSRLNFHNVPVEKEFSVKSLNSIPDLEERRILEPFVTFLIEDFKNVEDREERFALLMQILFDTLWALFYLGLEEDEE